MKMWLVIIGLMVLVPFSGVAVGHEKTKITSQYAKRKLLGRHLLSLQWISWEYYGRVRVSQKRGVLFLKGDQKGRDDGNYVKLNGVITEVNRLSFKFKGTITTMVGHNNGGEPCVREGEMTFAITKRRKYWRLQDMKSPCDGTIDYIDIYFRR